MHNLKPSMSLWFLNASISHNHRAGTVAKFINSDFAARFAGAINRPPIFSLLRSEITFSLLTRGKGEEISLSGP